MLQRLLSNTFLAFVSNIVTKAGNSLLFIFIGRVIGPSEAGLYNLGITYLTITLAFSSWGLHELLVREVAPRRGESRRYLSNYLVLRLSISSAAYILLLLFLRLNLPYRAEAKSVIYILALAIFPEAIFSLFQALFIAHEQLAVSTLAAFVNGVGKFAAGMMILLNNGRLVDIAWVIPISSSLSLLVFIFALFRLFYKVPQQVSALFDFKFCLAQLRFTPGFVIIGIFSTLDFQIDTLLISLLLSETDIGWYSAAQTIMLAFWMMPVAIRTAIYPLMARFHYEQSDKLAKLYRKTNQYLLVGVLPIAAGVSLLARPIIRLIFTDSFNPAGPVLSLTIWAIVFAFLNVPNARLMLVHNRQRQAGWMAGLSMFTNLVLNLWLVPRYGIVGAAVARVSASLVFFLSLYLYVQLKILHDDILPLVWRPALATAVMSFIIWQLHTYPLFLLILIGVVVYTISIFLLGAISPEDRQYLRQLYEV